MTPCGEVSTIKEPGLETIWGSRESKRIWRLWKPSARQFSAAKKPTLNSRVTFSKSAELGSLSADDSTRREESPPEERPATLLPEACPAQLPNSSRSRRENDRVPEPRHGIAPDKEEGLGNRR